MAVRNHGMVLDSCKSPSGPMISGEASSVSGMVVDTANE